MGDTSKVGSKSSRITATVALASAGSLWGTAFLFGKIAFREMSVSTNVSLRFCFGSLVLLPLLFRPTRRFRQHDFWTMLLASIVGVPLQFLIQFKGLALTTVSHASLMVSTTAPSENAVKTQIWIAVSHLCPGRHRAKAVRPGSKSVSDSTDS